MRRVAVVGLGVISSIGSGIEEFWGNLLRGVSGAREVKAFDTSALDRHIGCEVPSFPEEIERIRVPADASRTTQLACAAAALALVDAGLVDDRASRARTGVAIGTTMGEAQRVEHPSVREITPWRHLSNFACETTALRVADALGLEGPIATLPTACAAGNYACAHALDLMRDREADLMLAGGADAFSRMAFIGFSRLLAMSPDMCRPFDKKRRGLLLGEGAAMLVFEDMERARARGARIYAELLGYGLSCDAHHMTAPHPNGVGAALAMSRALSDAGVTPSDVDYVSAHGTGTPLNDRIETMAIKQVFGERAQDVPVSSVKGLLGHAMGAASAIESVVCSLAIAGGIVPATWNHDEADADCDLDYVAGTPRPASVGVALNNAYGFGGNNACVVFAHTDR